MRTIFPPILAAVLLGTAACGTKGVSIESQDPEATEVRRRPNRITAAELADLQHLNVGEAIERLRPRWLRSRSREDNFGEAEIPLAIFVNNFYRGGPNELSLLRVSNIERIQFLNERQSYQRFGPEHRSGAVLITLKGGN